MNYFWLINDRLFDFSKHTLTQRDMNTSNVHSNIAVFRPTMREFSNFNEYIKLMEHVGAHHQSGIAKVIPPSEWSPRPIRGRNDYSDANQLRIERYVYDRFI